MRRGLASVAGWEHRQPGGADDVPVLWDTLEVRQERSTKLLNQHRSVLQLAVAQDLLQARLSAHRRKSAKCKSISGAGTGRSARTASLAVSLARAFRRVPVPSTHFVRRQAGPLAHRPRMAATAFSLRGAFSGSGTVWSPRRGFILPDTSSKHDQKLGVELMRRYCDPRGDFAWDSVDRVRVHRWHRRCSPTSAHSTALLDVRFDDIFVNSSALVCLTTADRAGEACRAV